MTWLLRIRAPAKVNWSLEVLGRRPDGYHEVRTVLQTIALCDWLTLAHADRLSLSLSGEPSPLAGQPREANLAHRAAALLLGETGRSQIGGAHIDLEKRIPVAAGLGGGSSDAAAVLRGLRVLWQLPISDDALAALAAELGSDVSFFLRGGCALASSRGDVLSPLPDGPTQRLVLAWPGRDSSAGKTARMYAALGPRHYSDGAHTERLASRLREGQSVDETELYNVFEEVLPQVDAAAARAFEQAGGLGFGQPHLCGSGPAFFVLLGPEQEAAPLLGALQRLGLKATETHTLSAAEAVDYQEQA